MASSKVGGKKQDEKHLKLLREMAALSNNRHCFECGQRGPTYVNMTIGTFVCTACSGILRGLNPPHRVKSISMASFSPEEIDFLKDHGNEYNRHVWLGLHDSKSPPPFEPTEEHKLRDYLAQKYERKRWYMEPTAELKEQAKAWNAAAASAAAASPADSAAKPRSGSSLGPAPAVALSATFAGQRSQQSAGGGLAAVGIPGSGQHAAPTAAQPSSDLLSDLFAAPSTSAGHSTGFGAFPATFSNVPTVASHSGQQAQFLPGYVTSTKAPTLQAGNSPQHVQQSPFSAAVAGGLSSAGFTSSATTGSDKYAALADLFDSSPAATAPAPYHNETSLNWNPINWGATQSAVVNSTSGPSQHRATALALGGGPTTWNNVSLPATSMSSWPNGGITAAPTPASGITGNTFLAQPAYQPSWVSNQVAAPGSMPAVAPGAPANPFLPSATSTPFVPFTAAGGQSKVAGGFVLQGTHSASGASAVPFGAQTYGVSGSAPAFGPPQHPSNAMFQAPQSALFGQTPVPLGSVQATVGPPQNGSWASWGQGQQSQSRPAAAHSANPFASGGSATTGSTTNPFL